MKMLLKMIESISDSIYSGFYGLKMPKIGYFLTTPLYLVERLLIFAWEQVEDKS